MKYTCGKLLNHPPKRRMGGEKRGIGAAIAFLLLAPVLFLARVLLPWMPGAQTLATGDFIEVYYLQRLGAFQERMAGRVPLWAPWRFAGHPLALLVPPFSHFRNQERIIALWSFALAMLAGLGADELSRQRRPIGLLRGTSVGAGVLFGLSVLLSALGPWLPRGVESEVQAWREAMAFASLISGLTALWLGWWRKGGKPIWAWKGAALFILAVDLWTVGMRCGFRASRPSEFFPCWPLLDEIRSDPTGPWRVSSEGLLPGDGNAAVAYGLEDVVGNSPLKLQSYDEFIRQIPEWRWWQFLNVRYVLTKREISHPDLTLLGSRDGIHLYRFEAAIPRAYLVYRLMVAESAAQERLWLSATELDPLEAAIVRAPSPVTLPLGGPMGHPVMWIERRPTYLAFDVEAKADGVLVISQAFYPGWRAAVDGRPAELFPVNGILQGVGVPAGRHLVVVRYDPLSWRLGLVSSILGGLTLGGLLFSRRRLD